MQSHQLKIKNQRPEKKRIGRGGKRGTYSGHGVKGQKSRAGASVRPGFRGGDNPIWKLFPKQRGASKRVDVKHALFRLRKAKPAVINLTNLNSAYNEGEAVSKKSLLKKGLISSAKDGVKVLGQGELTKKIIFTDLAFSKSAREKIEKAGGIIKQK